MVRMLPILLLAALVAGCDLLREPTVVQLDDPPILVHGILRAGADSVFVRVGRTRFDAMPPGVAAAPIPGIELELAGGDVRVRLREEAATPERCTVPVPSGPFVAAREGVSETGLEDLSGLCYGAEVPGGVREATAYELRITLPDGTVVRGAATTPEAPQLVRPEEGLRISADPDHEWGGLVGRDRTSFQWNFAGTDVAGDLGARVEKVFEDGIAVSAMDCRIAGSHGRMFFDSAIADLGSWRLAALGCTHSETSSGSGAVRPDSVYATLLLTAYDSAVVRYNEGAGRESVRQRDAAVGLTGAVGLFAGAAETSREVILVATEDDEDV